MQRRQAKRTFEVIARARCKGGTCAGSGGKTRAQSSGLKNAGALQTSLGPLGRQRALSVDDGGSRTWWHWQFRPARNALQGQGERARTQHPSWLQMSVLQEVACSQGAARGTRAEGDEGVRPTLNLQLTAALVRFRGFCAQLAACTVRRVFRQTRSHLGIALPLGTAGAARTHQVMRLESSFSTSLKKQN
jgi:hypothetical protein